LIFDACDTPDGACDTPSFEIPLGNITSYTLTDQHALSQGLHTWTVHAFDAVGLSTTAAGRTVKVDMSNPGSPTLINPPDNGWSNQSEFILNWSAAKDPYGEICGYWLVFDQGKPNQKEPIFIAAISAVTSAAITAGTTAGTIAAPSNLSYQTGALAEGDHTWSVTTVDCAGNQGPPSAAWTIRIDRTPPAAPVPQWPENGEFVPEKRPTFRWSAPGDEPAGNPSRVCRYSITIGDNALVDNTLGGNSMGGNIIEGNFMGGNLMGGNTFETVSDETEYTPASDLPDGTVSWRVQAIDCARNIGTVSEVNTFTVDSIPPEIIAQPAEGFYNAPFFITLSMRDMGYSETGTIHYTTDGTQPAASSPEYSVPIEVSSDKEIFLKVAGFDRAGNKSPVKALRYILDTTAPVPDIDPLPDIWDECRVTVVTGPTATDSISGKITGTTGDPLTYTRPGSYTITWIYDDGHGNTTTQVQTIILTAPWAPPGAPSGAPSETGMQQYEQYGMVISGAAYDGLAPASGPGTLSDGTPYDGDWIGAFGPGGESDCRAVARIQADGHYDLIIGNYQEIASSNQAGAGGNQAEADTKQGGVDVNQAGAGGNQAEAGSKQGEADGNQGGTGVNQAEADDNQSKADNETITFKLLRCSDEQTLNSLESILFVPGETIQDKAIHFGTCTQSIELVKGWNWVSFYVLPYDTSIGAVFGDHAGSVRQIKTQTRSATNVPGLGWIGDDLNLLSMISKGVMFKIEATAGFTLNVVGTCITPDLPIEVQKGWTWIAYLPGMCLPCLPEDAHDGEISIFGDLYQDLYQVYQVKSQTQSRIKLPDGGFIGDLVQMCPGKGYTVKMNSSWILIYPNP